MSVENKISTFSSLRIPNFRLLLTATATGNAAQWLQQVTLSWLVYDLTGSGTMLGTIQLVRSVSAIAMIPVAGILIDRLKRRNMWVVTNGWQFIITLALGLAMVTGHNQIAYLFIFSFLFGIAGTVNNPLRQITVFDVVPRSHTPNAMALIQTGWSLMRALGPGVGGLLLLWIGPGGNFLIQAGAYALIILTILRVRFPEQITMSDKSSVIENIKEGIGYVAKQRVTRSFMLLGFVLPALIIPIFNILPPIYAVEVFGDNSGRILGFLLASIGVGGILGGIVTASLDRLEHRGLLQLGSLFMCSLSLVGFAFCTNLALALTCMASSGFFELIFLTTNQTMIQLSIPDGMRGRVTAVVNLNAVWAPLGGMLAGIGADVLKSPRDITIIMAGTTALILVLVLLLSPTIRNYQLSKAIKENPST